MAKATPTKDTKEKAAKKKAVAKAKAVAPKVAAPIGSTPKTKFRGNPDIFGTLVDDHDKHRALLAMIEQTEGKSKDRQKLFKELAKELHAHAAAEEQALWSIVLRIPKITEDGRHAVAEHKAIDGMIADLAARDMAKPAWLKRFSAFKDEYLHHIKEEEQEQFVAAEKHLSAADLKYIKSVFTRRKREEKAGATVKKKIKLKAGGLD